MVASREKMSSSSDDEEPLPREQHVRSWGKQWQVKGLNDMHASDKTSPRLPRKSYSPQSSTSTPQGSSTRAKPRTPIMDTPFESPGLRAVGSSPADLRSRRMPPPRSLAKESKDSNPNDRNPPQQNKTLEDDKTSPKGAANTPDLKMLKQKLRLYD